MPVEVTFDQAQLAARTFLQVMRREWVKRAGANADPADCNVPVWEKMPQADREMMIRVQRAVLTVVLRKGT